MVPTNAIEIPDAPTVPGLAFRHFRGPADYAPMAAVLNASAAADDLDWADTAEDVAVSLTHSTHCDLARDVIVAEIDGGMVGYGRVWWREMADGVRLYCSAQYLAPAGRGRGIRRALLHWAEARLRQIAADHPPGPKCFQVFTELNVTGLVNRLTAEDYTPIRYAFKMVRPTLDDIPDFPLPPGFEVRPVRPEQIRAIWEADVDAFRGQWGFSEPTEADYQAYVGNPNAFQPEMWQIAWDTATDQIAGQVKAFINRVENEKYNRRRGYTEDIAVGRPYRRRGLARALIVCSLRQQRDLGMTESALGVDAENETGALRVYEDCGFRVARRSAWFRKAL
jgi:GNAT superfamily N-acetyltransferase